MRHCSQDAQVAPSRPERPGDSGRMSPEGGSTTVGSTPTGRLRLGTEASTDSGRLRPAEQSSLFQGLFGRVSGGKQMSSSGGQQHCEGCGAVLPPLTGDEPELLPMACAGCLAEDDIELQRLAHGGSR